MNHPGPTMRLLWALPAFALLVFNACTCQNTPAKGKLKEVGVSCTHDDECEQGLCNDVGTSPPACLKPCSAGCETNEVCTGLSAERFACVLEKAGLCDHCTTAADCPYPGDECIDLGGERFCGRDCRFDGVCPPSFR